MVLLNGIKKMDFFNKFLNGDVTSNTLPYDFVPQKLKFFPPKKNDYPLARVTPESQGVSSKYLNDFYKEISKAKDINAHGLMILRHGKIISSGMWSPYLEEYPHITHSLCKSITSMAVGIAVDQRLIDINEKIVDIFPEKTSILTSKRVKSITVEHLLTMTSGIRFNESSSILSKDWVKSFLDSDTAFEPGSKFVYNSMNSYMLSAIVKRKTGSGLLEYLTPFLFEPLGIVDIIWEKCPRGNEKGGWGCYITLEDMAKLGQLYLQKGKWIVAGEEKQIVSEEWVNASTIEHAKEDNGISSRAYGYQMWMHNTISTAFQFNGLFGQYVMVLPKQDIVIAMTSGSTNLLPQGSTIDIVTKYFNDDVKFSDKALEENKTNFYNLKETLHSLKFGEPISTPSPSIVPWYRKISSSSDKKSKSFYIPEAAKEISGKIYSMEASSAGILPLIIQCMQNNFSEGISEISFNIENEKFCISIKEKFNNNKFFVGFGQYLYSDLQFKGENYRVAATGKFTLDEDDNMVLKLSISFIEMSNTRTIKIFFIDDNLVMKMDESPSVLFTIEKFKPKDSNNSIGNSRSAFNDSEFNNFKLSKIAVPIIRGHLKE